MNADSKSNKEEITFDPVLRLVTAIILTIACILAGLTLSIILKDFTNLARFGALISLIGLWMAYTEIKSSIRNMKDEKIKEYIHKDEFKRANVEFIIEAVREKSPEINEDKIKTLRELIENSPKIHESINNSHHDFSSISKDYLSNFSSKSEFFIISIGTLLWAFADLLNKFFCWQ